MTHLDPRLFAIAADLDTAHHALIRLADGASGDTQYVLYFVATYIEGVHAKLMREVEALEERPLKVVTAGKVS